MESDTLTKQIARWADSPAEHAQAAEALAEWGEHAIPGLRDYLRRGPQVIPQPRCFAVAMLARLHATAATECLRSVLREHPLKSLPPAFAEAEYVVKSGALNALCARSYEALVDDVAFGIGERLRIAVEAAGRLRLVAAGTQLVDFLDDDVLADTAMDALGLMGSGAAAAIAPRLDAWLSEAAFSARRRLAVVRAFRIMQRVHAAGMQRVIQHALADEHAGVRAVGALLAWPARRDATVMDGLVRGAVGFDRGLADDCRAALAGAGMELVEPVQRALHRDAEPDLYGDERALSFEQTDWLARRLAERQ